MTRNELKDIIKECLLEMSIVNEKCSLEKDVQEQISDILKKYAKELDKKYKNNKNLTDHGNFENISISYDENAKYKTIDIDFVDISQEEFFNFDYRVFKNIAETMKTKLKPVIDIYKTNICDDCPIIWLFYK